MLDCIPGFLQNYRRNEVDNGEYFPCTLYSVNGKKVVPLQKDIKGSVLYIKKPVEEGKFKTGIDRKYQPEQITEACRYLEMGQKTGNVVITLEE